MSYEVRVIQADDGDPAPLPPNTHRYTVLSETDEEGRVQIACLIDAPDARGVA